MDRLARMLIESILLVAIFAILLIPVPADAVQQVDQTSQGVFQSQPYAVSRGTINLRGGPGLGFWIVGTLYPNETVPILGVNGDLSWWLVDTDLGEAWVSNIAVDAFFAADAPIIDPGPIGSVTSGALNVRQGAGSNAVSVGRLSNGEQVFVLARNVTGEWLQIRWAYGIGWVSSLYVALSGEVNVLSEDVPLTDDTPIGIVTAAYLNVRTGPGINYAIIGQILGSRELPILGRSSDSRWYQVETEIGIGWVFAEYLATQYAFSGIPVTVASTTGAQVVGPLAVINTSAVNLRSGPGPDFTVLAILAGGEEGQIIGQTADSTWWLVEMRVGTGWIYAVNAALRGDLSSVSIIDPESPVATGVLDSDIPDGATVPVPALAAPVAVVNTGALNVRSGPNDVFDSLGVVYGGTELTILGQSMDGGWWHVESAFGPGWIAKSLVIVRGDTSGIPVTQ